MTHALETIALLIIFGCACGALYFALQPSLLGV